MKLKTFKESITEGLHRFYAVTTDYQSGNHLDREHHEGPFGSFDEAKNHHQAIINDYNEYAKEDGLDLSDDLPDDLGENEEHMIHGGEIGLKIIKRNNS